MAFEKELRELLERTKNIKSPINAASIDTNMHEYNKPSKVWMNDVELFASNYLQDHPLLNKMKTSLFHSKYNEVVAELISISNDKKFLEKMNGITEVTASKYQVKIMPEYDLFISHANSDKLELVEELYQSLNKLGINIFYDKESIEWGDNWKQRLLDGVNKAEFAIIVISENFFGREWTEIELNELLSRQNRLGQKLILPILKNISISMLQEKYPDVADIQAIDSAEHTTDEIAVMFARQFIKRLKAQ